MYPYLEAGEEIDGYRVLGRVHSGGMAVLYRVEGADTRLPLVMKVPRLAQGEDPVSVVSYEVEQMMLSALSGPHVPRLMAAGDLERLPYLLMEYIDGPTLKQFADKAPLPADEVVRLILPVAIALNAVHRQHLVHLDIKPANIIYRASGEAVLIDLGLAHHAHFPDLLAEEFRKPLGSAPYMAPEQVACVHCDPRSDIFALGAIMYQLLTGVMPFGSPGSVSGLRARVTVTPDWLQEIVLRCMEVDARDRYATAAQLAFDLAHADQVRITERGTRTAPAGFVTHLFRRWAAVGYEPAPCPPSTGQVSTAPIVLVGVDTQLQGSNLTVAMQEMVKRIIASNAEYRIALAIVIRPVPLLGTSDADDSAARTHIRELLELRNWAAGLELADGQVTVHVLQDNDPALALLDYAAINQVDQIVIGAARSANALERSPVLRPLLGSVASHVVSEAPCTVTVVRPRDDSVP